MSPGVQSPSSINQIKRVIIETENDEKSIMKESPQKSDLADSDRELISNYVKSVRFATENNTQSRYS